VDRNKLITEDETEKSGSSFEHGKEVSYSIKAEKFLDQLRDC
jgi:hypothetical protein